MVVVTIKTPVTTLLVALGRNPGVLVVSLVTTTSSISSVPLLVLGVGPVEAATHQLLMVGVTVFPHAAYSGPETDPLVTGGLPSRRGPGGTVRLDRRPGKGNRQVPSPSRVVFS